MRGDEISSLGDVDPINKDKRLYYNSFRKKRVSLESLTSMCSRDLSQNSLSTRLKSEKKLNRRSPRK